MLPFVIALAAAVTARVDFDPTTVAWSLERGGSRISGQGFLGTRGGNIKTCAGNEVFLIPDSPYAKFRMQVFYGGLERGFLGSRRSFAQREHPDPDYVKTSRKAVCDADGRFTFSRLPAGRYYVVTTVVWEAATGWGGRPELQGGDIMLGVDVAADDEQVIVVTW